MMWFLIRFRDRETKPGEVRQIAPIIVTHGETYEHRFQVRNTTDREIRILGRSNSCDCTFTHLDRTSLAPGECATLTLTVKLPRQFIRRSLESTLRTDHPKYPNWVYKLDLTIYPDIRVEPDLTIVDAEEFDGNHRPKTVWIEQFYREGQAPAPFELGVPPEVALAVAGEPEVSAMGRGILRKRSPIRVRVDEVSLRAFPNKLLAFTVGTPAATRVSASIYWKQEPALRCEPPLIHFRTSRRAVELAPLTWSVSSRRGEPFRIDDVVFDTQVLDVQWESGESWAREHPLRMKRPRPGTMGVADGR